MLIINSVIYFECYYIIVPLLIKVNQHYVQKGRTAKINFLRRALFNLGQIQLCAYSSSNAPV
ncbi:hypothetical protein KL86CLO1_12432 [uncultured Eubacteriales bacterium]|uniref:Uncharacterized protein n=1 Tax=uncultured Eubacteriales bacterium TaxID=172733 RepID=A0A212K9C9_9FIRM|nr:hypothetical protein KL86CLO1_12432 [uncultured Eubacteriales bacterium]